MRVFVVERTGDIMWCEDYKMVVIEETPMRAERQARWASEDFKKAKLRVTEIDMSKPGVVSRENKGG